MLVLCDAAAGATAARAADGRATSGAVSVASAGVGADGELVVAPGVLANANLWPRRSQRSC